MQDSAAELQTAPSTPPSHSSPFHVGLLLIVTLIWGTTFIATKLLVGGDKPLIAPGGMIFVRFLIASICFLPAVLGHRFPRAVWLPGAELSLWLWAGYATQAIGLQYTSVTRSAFVTSLNVVFVPILMAIAGRRVGWVVWFAVVLALVGAGLLNYDGGPPNLGDLWTIGCTTTYAVYIIRLGHFTGRFDSRSITAVQLWGVTALSLPWWLLEATVGGAGWGTWNREVILGMLYMGTIATLLTTWLQAIGQQGVPSIYASLLYTTEPVFASAIAMLFFAETLGTQGWVGTGLILLAAVASQVLPLLLGRKEKMIAAPLAGVVSEVP